MLFSGFSSALIHLLFDFVSVCYNAIRVRFNYQSVQTSLIKCVLMRCTDV